MEPDTHIIEFNTSNNTQIPIQTKWDRMSCEIPIKDICKKISESKQLANWRLLNRTRCFYHEKDLAQIHWKATYKCLHTSNINNPFTSTKDQQLRKFSLQLWNGELPTKHKLFSRKPDLYKDNKCLYCQHIEDNVHPFICPNNQINIHQYIRDSILKISEQQLTMDQFQTLKNILKNKPLFTTNTLLKQFICGAISNKLYYILRQATDNTTSVYQLLKHITSHIKETLWEIWKQRCEDFHNWKISKGITRKIEKIKKYQKQTKDSKFVKEEQIIKSKWITMVNITINNFIQFNSNIFDLFKINSSISYALALMMLAEIASLNK